MTIVNMKHNLNVHNVATAVTKLYCFTSDEKKISLSDLQIIQRCKIFCLSRTICTAYTLYSYKL